MKKTKQMPNVVSMIEKMVTSPSVEADEARRERARRMWGKREFRTTEEFREEAVRRFRAARGEEGK